MDTVGVADRQANVAALLMVDSACVEFIDRAGETTNTLDTLTLPCLVSVINSVSRLG